MINSFNIKIKLNKKVLLPGTASLSQTREMFKLLLDELAL